jgi:hypothetical protein
MLAGGIELPDFFYPALETIKPFFPVSGLATSLLVFSAVFLVQFYGSAGVAVAIKHFAGSRSRWLIG